MPILLIAASVAAAIIHFAYGPEHLAELGPLGLGFYISGALQLGWAVLAIAAARSQARSSLASAVVPSGIVLNLAVLLAWVASRTVGLPAGDHPWTPEAVGVADGICALLEIGIVVGLLARTSRLARRSRSAVIRSPGRRPMSTLAMAGMLLMIAVATVTAVSAHEAHDPANDMGGHMGAAGMSMSH